MKWRAKADPKAGKVAFEVLAGRQEGRGIFAIEDAAEEVARRTKLALIAERIASYDRGYTGNRRRCLQCGQWQQYQDLRSGQLASCNARVAQFSLQVDTKQTGAEFIHRLSQFLGLHF